MMEEHWELDHALYTYAIAGEDMERFSQHERLKHMALVVNHTSRTEVIHRVKEGREIAVIGLCVDSHGELEREMIPEFLLNKQGGITDLYYACNRFAGKYVILYFDGKHGFLWGDATCLLSINYGFDENDAFCAASTDKLVASRFHYEVSSYSHAIRYTIDSKLPGDARLSYPLPGDVTMYDCVKVLLPNHYLDLDWKQAVRVPLNALSCKDRQSMETAITESTVLIKNIVREYDKYRDLICPLTSGYDSRMVFSFVKEQIPNVQCYTFRHRGFTDQTPDMTVPKRICESYHQPYKVFDDEDANQTYIQKVFETAGSYHSTYAIHMAHKIQSMFPGKTVMNGQISDEIGKCFYVNSVPNWSVTPAFLQAFQHNWGPETRQEEKKYISTIRCSGEGGHLCDLFAMEISCGRLSAQSNMLYSLCGTDMLNIYNCRDVILKWISIPRRLRKNKWIHEHILRLNDRKLLDFPFNGGKKSRFYTNWWVYYRAYHCVYQYYALLRHFIRKTSMPKARDS